MSEKQDNELQNREEKVILRNKNTTETRHRNKGVILLYLIEFMWNHYTKQKKKLIVLNTFLSPTFLKYLDTNKLE